MLIITHVYLVLEIVQEIKVIPDLQLVAGLTCEGQEVSPILLVKFEDLVPIHILLQRVHRHLLDHCLAVEDALVYDLALAIELYAQPELAALLEVANVPASGVAGDGAAKAVGSTVEDLAFVNVPHLALC